MSEPNEKSAAARSGEKNKIFRQESLQRISSPEALNEYLQVTTPAVWILLMGIVIFLVGIIVWGLFGTLESREDIGVVVTDSHLTGYVSEQIHSQISVGAKIELGGQDLSVSAISGEPVQVTQGFDTYLKSAGNLSDGEWVYEIQADADLPDGKYKAAIVSGSVSPASFVLN